MEQGDIGQAYATYCRLMGAHPSPQEKVTGDQLTAMRSPLAEGFPPYVSMAVWRGCGCKKKLAFQTVELPLMVPYAASRPSQLCRMARGIPLAENCSDESYLL
eukprot:2265444-Amphidinium_carterae.1